MKANALRKDEIRDGQAFVASAVAATAIAACACVVVAVATLLLCGSILFPDKTNAPLEVYASVSGKANDEAQQKLAAATARAQKTLHDLQVAPERISISPVTEVSGTNNRVVLLQTISVAQTSYREAAYMYDAFRRRATAPELTEAFPKIPFESLLIIVGIVTVLGALLSLTALEMRASEAGVKPRGMRPFTVAAQTLMYGITAASIDTYAHLASTVMRGLYVAIFSACFVALALWLYTTRNYWQTFLLAILQRVYVAGLALLAAAFVWTLL